MLGSCGKRFLIRVPRAKSILSRWSYDPGYPLPNTVENTYRFPQLLLPPEDTTPYSKHHRVTMDFTATPPTTWISPMSSVIGRVLLGSNVSIWDGCVIRGDLNSVTIGNVTNVQEGTVITEAFGPVTGCNDGSTWIGNHVTIGPRSHLRACTIGALCVIGAASKIGEGATVGGGSALHPGTYVPPGFQIPQYQVWEGNPARYVRDITPHELEEAINFAEKYAQLANNHHTYRWWAK